MAETCRKRAAREYPDKIDTDHFGGVRGCPDTYGYLDPPPYCNAEYRVGYELACAVCWSREIPDEKEKENENMAYPNYEELYNNEHAERMHLEEKLEYQDKYVKTLEARLEKYQLVVKCVEVFTGEKLDIE